MSAPIAGTPFSIRLPELDPNPALIIFPRAGLLRRHPRPSLETNPILPSYPTARCTLPCYLIPTPPKIPIEPTDPLHSFPRSLTFPTLPNCPKLPKIPRLPKSFLRCICFRLHLWLLRGTSRCRLSPERYPGSTMQLEYPDNPHPP